MTKPMNKELTRNADSVAVQWIAAYQEFVDDYVKLGKLLVKAVEDCGKEVLIAIRARMPGIPSRALDQLYDVGIGRISPKLLTMESDSARALARCPIEEQTRFLDEPVPVYNPEEPSEVRTIPLAELSPKQVSVVFARRHVRSPAEQRTYLQECNPKPIRFESAYYIRNNKVILKRDCEFTKTQLALMMGELK